MINLFLNMKSKIFLTFMNLKKSTVFSGVPTAAVYQPHPRFLTQKKKKKKNQVSTAPPIFDFKKKKKKKKIGGKNLGKKGQTFFVRKTGEK